MKTEFKKIEPVEIRFAITNTTDKQVNVLKWTRLSKGSIRTSSWLNGMGRRLLISAE